MSAIPAEPPINLTPADAAGRTASAPPSTNAGSFNDHLKKAKTPGAPNEPRADIESGEKPASELSAFDFTTSHGLESSEPLSVTLTGTAPQQTDLAPRENVDDENARVDELPPEKNQDVFSLVIVATAAHVVFSEPTAETEAPGEVAADSAHPAAAIPVVAKLPIGVPPAEQNPNLFTTHTRPPVYEQADDAAKSKPKPETATLERAVTVEPVKSLEDVAIDAQPEPTFIGEQSGTIEKVEQSKRQPSQHRTKPAELEVQPTENALSSEVGEAAPESTSPAAASRSTTPVSIRDTKPRASTATQPALRKDSPAILDSTIALVTPPSATTSYSTASPSGFGERDKTEESIAAAGQIERSTALPQPTGMRNSIAPPTTSTELRGPTAPPLPILSKSLPGALTPGSNLGEVDRVRFVQRVARAVQTAAERGGEIRLRLSPPELGSLKLEVTLHEGVMNARLETETATTRGVLIDNLQALRERLAEQNIKLDRFDVDVRDGSAGSLPDRTTGQADSEAQREAVARGRNRRADSAHENAKPQAVTPRVIGQGQLNVIV